MSAGRPAVAVGAVVVVDDSLLLVRRGRGAAVGLWSVPGGHVEWGETLAQAVEREVAEETGLAVRCGQFIGWVERMDGDHHYVIMDFAASLVSGDGSEAAAADDAAEVVWWPLAGLAELPLVPGLSDFLAQHGIVG